MTLLLRMKTGSHLYGTNHAGSDVDFLEVHTSLGVQSRQAKQVFEGEEDITSFSLGKWVALAEKGVPQVIESMFAPVGWAEVDEIVAFRLGFRPNVGNLVNTYQRTIYNFRKSESPKRVRHADRLEYNLNVFLKHGYFNPRDTGWAF